MSVSEARSPLRDEVSRSKCCIGSWKTTRSIGRACTAGDRLSRPVLTAKQLDHPDRLSAVVPAHERRAGRSGGLTDSIRMTDDRWQMPGDRGLVLVLADVPLLLVWREEFVLVTDHRGSAAGVA